MLTKRKSELWRQRRIRNSSTELNISKRWGLSLIWSCCVKVREWRWKPIISGTRWAKKRLKLTLPTIRILLLTADKVKLVLINLASQVPVVHRRLRLMSHLMMIVLRVMTAIMMKMKSLKLPASTKNSKLSETTKRLSALRMWKKLSWKRTSNPRPKASSERQLNKRASVLEGIRS